MWDDWEISKWIESVHIWDAWRHAWRYLDMYRIRSYHWSIDCLGINPPRIFYLLWEMMMMAIFSLHIRETSREREWKDDINPWIPSCLYFKSSGWRWERSESVNRLMISIQQREWLASQWTCQKPVPTTTVFKRYFQSVQRRLNLLPREPMNDSIVWITI